MNIIAYQRRLDQLCLVASNPEQGVHVTSRPIEVRDGTIHIAWDSDDGVDSVEHHTTFDNESGVESWLRINELRLRIPIPDNS